MERRLIRTLAPVMAGGLLALLTVTAWSAPPASSAGPASSAAESGHRHVPARWGSGSPATMNVANEPRSAQRPGLATWAAGPAAPANAAAVNTRTAGAVNARAAAAVNARTAGAATAVNARTAGAAAAAVGSRTTARLPYESDDAQGLQAKWYRQVEYPLQLSSINRQIALVQARVSSYQKRLERYSQYNAAAPPQSGSFSPSEILPQPPEYYPQTAATPVQAFSPPSTFSHVWGDVTRKCEESQAELNSLVKRRERIVANGPDGLLPATRSLGAVSDYDQRLNAIAAERKFAEFKHESLEARVRQFDRLSQLTYSLSYADLREKLILGCWEAKLRLDALDEERKLLEAHHDDWQQLQKAGQ